MTSARRLDAPTTALPTGGLLVNVAQARFTLDPMASAVWSAADGSRSTDDLLAVARAVDPGTTQAALFEVCDELADAGLLTTRLAPPTGAVQRRHVMMGLAAAAFGLALPARAQSLGDAVGPLAPAPTAADTVAAEAATAADAAADAADANDDVLDAVDQLAMPEDELDPDFPEPGEVVDGISQADQLPPLQGLAWDEQAAQGWVIEADAFVVEADAWVKAPLDVEPPTEVQREARAKLLQRRRDLFRKQQAEMLAKRRTRISKEAEHKQQRRDARQAQREQDAKQRLSLRQRQQEEDAKVSEKQREERAKGTASPQRQKEENEKLRQRQSEARQKQRQDVAAGRERRRAARSEARESHAKMEQAQRQELRALRQRQREADAKAQQARAKAAAARRQEMNLKSEARDNAESALVLRKQEAARKVSDRRTEAAIKAK